VDLRQEGNKEEENNGFVVFKGNIFIPGISWEKGLAVRN